MSKEIKYIPKYEIDTKPWFLAWNNPKNPFANWHEPMPFPEVNENRAPKNELLAFLWWQFWRNPLHNLTHFTLGIVPVGKRYEWITPDEAGWVRNDYGDHSCWTKIGKKPKCRKYYSFGPFEAYIGWSERGSFGISFRKKH